MCLTVFGAETTEYLDNHFGVAENGSDSGKFITEGPNFSEIFRDGFGITGDFGEGVTETVDTCLRFVGDLYRLVWKRWR